MYLLTLSFGHCILFEGARNELTNRIKLDTTNMMNFHRILTAGLLA